jgi:hypothetical protein
LGITPDLKIAQGGVGDRKTIISIAVNLRSNQQLLNKTIKYVTEKNKAGYDHF